MEMVVTVSKEPVTDALPVFYRPKISQPSDIIEDDKVRLFVHSRRAAIYIFSSLRSFGRGFHIAFAYKIHTRSTRQKSTDGVFLR